MNRQSLWLSIGLLLVTLAVVIVVISRLGGAAIWRWTGVPEWVTYHDIDHGFSFKYPPDVLGPVSVDYEGEQWTITVPYRSSGVIDSDQIADGEIVRWGLRITIYRDDPNSPPHYTDEIMAYSDDSAYSPVLIAGHKAFREEQAGDVSSPILSISLRPPYFIERIEMPVNRKEGSCPFCRWPDVSDPNNALLFSEILATFKMQ